MGDLEDMAARLGLARAPGESDDALTHRMWRRLEAERGYGTRCDYVDWARSASRLVRHVKVDGGGGEVRVRVRAFLGLPVPPWTRARVERKLTEERPVNVRLVVE